MLLGLSRLLAKFAYSSVTSEAFWISRHPDVVLVTSGIHTIDHNNDKPMLLSLDGHITSIHCWWYNVP